MKLPRWLTVCLITLSVAMVLAVAGWWWLTWPTRTIREFIALAAAGQFDEANGMLKPPDRWVPVGDSEVIDLEDGTGSRFWATSRNLWESSFLKAARDFQFDSRTLSDLVLGRASVTLKDLPRTSATDYLAERHWRLSGWVIAAERGNVSISRPNPLDDSWRAASASPAGVNAGWKSGMSGSGTPWQPATQSRGANQEGR